ncbi:energy-coupling factor transporter transmembrane component T family protein [Actinoplanes derwentensis]|uniref:Energy-coupling factor transport system permease protein n=1 Tax=Actinoplanes derwentensis TaxID=113562 RepID=A0A1H2CAP5_9ACTN|nr:energy-coupling factor transporter transmembrane component T [Actinoplanes derwentensis]GID89054.1 ABC transporter [Actinoplanes derwentensis]SDT67399.1 energy-coupling factor transport system permease protein [Actinoplanes derwentensis]
MTLSFAPIADPTAPLARRNPVAKAGAALLFTLPLISTVDPFTPAAALVVEVLVLPFFGVRPGLLLRRAMPLLLSAAGILVTMILFAADRTGSLLLALGPITVTTGVLSTAFALILRIFAIALPGIVVFATTDPTDLADALVQNAKAPARFAIGALAAFRLIPLLGQEWRTLTLARRARGVDAGHNPLARLRLFASTAFALLVGALRRGVRLAVAMDARGFDSGVPRTYARRQRFTTPDTFLLASAFLTALAIIAAAVFLGFFNPIVG